MGFCPLFPGSPQVLSFSSRLSSIFLSTPEFPSIIPCSLYISELTEIGPNPSILKRNAVGTNLTCKLSLICKIQWRNYTAWQSRRKDIIKNVIKKNHGIETFTLQLIFPLIWLLCVRIFSMVLLSVLSHFRNVKTLSDCLKENVFLLSNFPFYEIMEVNYWICIQFSVFHIEFMWFAEVKT